MEEKIEEMLRCGRRVEAIGVLEEYLKERNDAVWMLRLGELLYAEGRLADALNQFNALLRLDSDNQKAKNYVSMIRNVFDYYNKDLLNP